MQITSGSISHQKLLYWRITLLAAMFSTYLRHSFAELFILPTWRSTLCFYPSLNVKIWWTHCTWLDLDPLVHHQAVFFLCQNYCTASMCRWEYHIQDFSSWLLNSLSFRQYYAKTMPAHYTWQVTTHWGVLELDVSGFSFVFIISFIILAQIVGGSL